MSQASTELDPLAILQTLGLRRPESVAPVSGGFDARIWRVEYASQRFALRVLRPSQRDTARREIESLIAAQADGLPVPTLHTHGSYHEHPAMLLGWCPGRTLIDALGRQPWRVRALGLAFGRAQARIHRIAAPPGLPVNWIEWAGNEPLLEQRLRRVQHTPPALLHGDYHPLNVLVQGDRISCILDWANARGGDPRADVARTYTILRIEPLGPHATPQMEVGRRILAWYWRRGYREVAGHFDESAVFRAWAGAVMQRDLAHRVGQPGSGLTAADMQHIRSWTDRQRQNL